MNQYNYGPENYDPNDPYRRDPYQRDPYQQDPYGQGPYQQNPQQSPRRYKKPGSSGMAMASVVLGICSFVLMMSGMSTFLGGLGILLALLSRGSGKISGTGKAGLAVSACGLVIGTGVMFFLIYMTLNSSLYNQYNELFNEYYYGDDYHDGHDFDDYEYYDEFIDGYDFGDGYGEYLFPDGGWYDSTPETLPDTENVI